jgi:MFS-type transporter involved in bile tolerance (Atg22 family)
MDKIPESEKANKLALAIATEVSKGWRVESQSQIQGVLAKGKNVNHTLQIFFSVITAGFWLLAYIPMAIINRRQTKIVRIDDFGNTLFE